MKFVSCALTLLLAAVVNADKGRLFFQYNAFRHENVQRLIKKRESAATYWVIFCLCALTLYLQYQSNQIVVDHGKRPHELVVELLDDLHVDRSVDSMVILSIVVLMNVNMPWNLLHEFC